LIAQQQEEIVTHFCSAAQYTPQALNNIMDNPTTSRYEAAKGLIESVGGTLISIARVAIHPDGCILIIVACVTLAGARSLLHHGGYNESTYRSLSFSHQRGLVAG
jgi:hypothetical protein